MYFAFKKLCLVAKSHCTVCSAFWCYTMIRQNSGWRVEIIHLWAMCTSCTMQRPILIGLWVLVNKIARYVF